MAYCVLKKTAWKSYALVHVTDHNLAPPLFWEQEQDNIYNQGFCVTQQKEKEALPPVVL